MTTLTDFAKAKHLVNSHHSYELEAAIADAIAAERERCASIVENALRDDFKSKTGHGRELSEAELFFSKRIRAGGPFG